MKGIFFFFFIKVTFVVICYINKTWGVLETVFHGRGGMTVYPRIVDKTLLAELKVQPVRWHFNVWACHVQRLSLDGSYQESLLI